MAGARSRDHRLLAMIPARRGSTRLPAKNLALLDGKPLIAYAIEAAKASGVFDEVIVNSEDEVFKAIADRYGVMFYRRPAEWATSSATSDRVVYDFLERHPCEAVAWVNPTSPLQTGEEVRQAVEHFLHERLDSLITVKREQVHTMCDGRPVNFNPAEPFARTQDLTPVEPFVYSVMMWRREAFLRSFEMNGHAILCGRMGVFPVSTYSAIIVKTAEDLRLAEGALRARRLAGTAIAYDAVLKLSEEPA